MGIWLLLIKACLFIIPLYHLSLFRIHVRVADRTEGYMRRFLWLEVGEDVKDHLVNWEICCKSKNSGTLGIGNLRLDDLSFLAKWFWCFPKEPVSLWHRVIRSARHDWNVTTRRYVSHHSPWKVISLAYPTFLPHACFQVGNGFALRFREDQWLNNQPLATKFHRLYNLSSRHQGPVSQFLTHTDNGTSLNFQSPCNLSDKETLDMLFLLDLLTLTIQSSQLDGRL